MEQQEERNKKNKELCNTLLSFRELEYNWDSYGGEKIDGLSVNIASLYLRNMLDLTIKNARVFPMRDGGVQFEIGDNLEVEINGLQITETLFDDDCNVLTEYKYSYSGNNKNICSCNQIVVKDNEIKRNT